MSIKYKLKFKVKFKLEEIKSGRKEYYEMGSQGRLVQPIPNSTGPVLVPMENSLGRGIPRGQGQVGLLLLCIKSMITLSKPQDPNLLL